MRKETDMDYSAPEEKIPTLQEIRKKKLQFYETTGVEPTFLYLGRHKMKNLIEECNSVSKYYFPCLFLHYKILGMKCVVGNGIDDYNDIFIGI